MPRKNKASKDKKDKSVKAKPAEPQKKPAKLLNPEVITPVMHSTPNPEKDPEAEVKHVSTAGFLNRPYFKGFPILKAYHGRQLKYFVKMADGMTAFMFSPGGDEEAMFKHLIGQSKVASMVPLSLGEKRGTAIQHVQINGLRMNVIKGRIVHLPEQIAQLLADSQADTAEALSNVETINPETGASVNANLAYRDDDELKALTR